MASNESESRPVRSTDRADDIDIGSSTVAAASAAASFAFGQPGLPRPADTVGLMGYEFSFQQNHEAGPGQSVHIEADV